MICFLAMALRIFATLTATVTPGTATVIRMIPATAGATPYTDSAGNIWTLDTGVCSDGTLSTTNSATHVSNTLPSAADQALYNTGRINAGTCTWNVPPGPYTVTLKFDENYYSAAGQRVFNVVLNGQPWLTNFDIYATAGGAFIGNDQTTTVTVTGTTLTLGFVNIVGGTKYTAVQIQGTSTAPVVTLNWGGGVVAPPTYNVYRLTGPCPSGNVAAPPTNSGFTLIQSGLASPQYVDTSAVHGTTYCYVTTTVQESGPSNPAQAAP